MTAKNSAPALHEPSAYDQACDRLLEALAPGGGDRRVTLWMPDNRRNPHLPPPGAPVVLMSPGPDGRFPVENRP